MIVATATDAAYVELTAVLLASLAAHAGGEVERVVVFCDNVDAEDQARMRASYPPGRIDFVDLAHEMERHFGARPVNHHLSRTAYARILMPLLLPQAQGRLLYVDCDTLINAPLAPLASLDMQRFAVAAVDDIARLDPARHAQRNQTIGLPGEMRYFNSGVLLIDLDQWRREGLSERVMAFAADHPDLPMMDQDALNGTLRGNWLVLDERWNLHRRLVKGRYEGDPVEWDDAAIIHFIGQIKPNYADCAHPARDRFLSHRARTPFAQARMKTKLSRKIEKRLRKWRRFRSWLRRRLPGAGRPA
ncbi:glycosyltransferase family 8 protein [Ancylobacter oerskovii]|uniref:Glycosyltransferase family 8 protein n=1 Tax=Ancylobacter oerskovii TaxID=459519 RepID=A0ABW4YY28_9HYPH|nr:glycosyltransferase family 8 protein [Ancylobacter oerskovii]MBS7541761.1 glycosyltransferase family 8 protein [Ancylobacter oerskovii]